MPILIAAVIGLIFGAGITLGGMINPAKVLNFFDVAGTWDPSLAFVMGSALVVTGIGYRLVWKRPAPIFEAKFQVPTRKDLDLPLIAGAAFFGIGWGIAGFCPGGSIPALGLFEPQAFIFVGSMLAGLFIAKTLRKA